MLWLKKDLLVGPKGSLAIRPGDEECRRFMMLVVGECTNKPGQAARQFGLSRQRYYQVLAAYREKGMDGLRSHKTGPKRNYRRTDEVVREVIRYLFLDPEMSAEVIAQKLVQSGKQISIRSVQRIIEHHGLQKKTLSETS